MAFTQNFLNPLIASNLPRDDGQESDSQLEHILEARPGEVEQLNNLLTLMYLFLEAGRLQIKTGRGTSLRDKISKVTITIIIPF